MHLLADGRIVERVECGQPNLELAYLLLENADVLRSQELSFILVVWMQLLVWSGEHDGNHFVATWRSILQAWPLERLQNLLLACFQIKFVQDDLCRLVLKRFKVVEELAVLLISGIFGVYRKSS